MPKFLSYPLSIVALSLVYWASGQLGLAVAVPGDTGGIIWPPAGVALATLLRFGMGLWPGVALGSALLTWQIGLGAEEIVAITLGGTLAALAGTWLLKRSGRFHFRLRHMDHMLALTVYGGIVAGLVGAGATLLGTLTYSSGPTDPLSAGLFNWLGTTGGVLLVAPVLLLWGGDGTAWRLPRPVGETLIAFALLTLATAIGFGLLPLGGKMTHPLAFAPIPVLVWIALRLPLLWIAMAIVLTVTIAGIGTAGGHGPFGIFAHPERQLLLWTFGVMVGMTTLLLGFATEARRRATERLRHLAQVVERIGATHNLRELMDIVRRAARQLTDADGATFVLRDGDHCHYADEDAIGPLWKGQRFPLASCISGWVMLNRQPVAIENIYADPRIPHQAYRPTFIKSLTMVPIGHDEPRGAIGCYWASRHQASGEELMLHQALAEATAVGLANIELYEKLDAMRCGAESAAANLRISEAFKDKVLEGSLNGLCLYDLKADRFEYVNGQFTSLTGYTLDDLNAMTVEQFLALFHSADAERIARHREALAAATEDSAHEIEYRFHHAGGHWVWLLSHDSVFERDTEGSPRRILGTFVDITARREAEEHERTQRDDLNRAQQRTVVAEVATSLADALSQPLTALTNYCELALSLAENIGDAPPQLRKALAEACDQAQRASSVARRLHALIDWESSGQTVVSLDPLIDDVLALMRPEADRSDTQIRYDPGTDSSRVMIDRHQIKQVLIALLHNSLEAMQRAASPQREIVVQTRQREGWLEVTIEDTGPGLATIPMNDLFDLWEPSRHHGSGINLSACRSIIEAHGGRLLASAGESGGALLCFALPLAPDKEEQLVT